MKRMRRSVKVIATLSLGMAAAGVWVRPLSAAPNAATSAPQPGLSAIVASIDAFYARITTFSSGYKQVFFIKAHPEAPRKSQGRVVFEKPGKMSFRSDNGNRVVSDGQVLKMYDSSDQQMIVQSLSGTQYPAALAFLMGQGNLSASFTFQLLDPTIPGTHRLLGTPRSSNAPYTTVVFYVDVATSQVRKVSILDAQGNRNQFEFVNPVVNVTPPSGEFVFTAPPGTQIVAPAGTQPAAPPSTQPAKP